MSDYTMDDLARGYPARQEVNRLRNENEDLRDGAEHDHRLVAELEAEVKRLRAEVRDRDQIEAGAADRIAKLSNKVRALEMEVNRLKGLLKEARVKVAHYIKVKDEWIDKAVELRKQLDAAQ